MNAIVVAWIAGDGLVVAPAKSPLATAAFAAVCAFATLAFVGFINGMLTTGQVFGLTMGELATAAFAAVCAFATLAFVGFINGMLTTGQVFGLTMGELAASPIAAFGKPTGSLLVLALVAVFVQSIEQVCAKGADADATCAEGGER